MCCTPSRNWRTSSGLRTTGNVSGILGAGMTSSNSHFFWSVTLYRKRSADTRYADRSGRQFLLHRQVKLVGANLLRAERFWGLAEVPCKQRDLLHVGGLSRRREIPHRHVFD